MSGSYNDVSVGANSHSFTGAPRISKVATPVTMYVYEAAGHRKLRTYAEVLVRWYSVCGSTAKTEAMTIMMDPLSCDFLKNDAPIRENEVRASPARIVKPTMAPCEWSGKQSTLRTTPTAIQLGR